MITRMKAGSMMPLRGETKILKKIKKRVMTGE
jgi:hypothetical protein